MPGRSIRRAPAGMMGRAPPRPTTETIRPSVITTTGSSITRPASTSIIRSAVTTTVCGAAGAGWAAAKAGASASASRRRNLLHGPVPLCVPLP